MGGVLAPSRHRIGEHVFGFPLSNGRRGSAWRPAMKEFDVAIIGAGPAGCSAAITLAQDGYHVALIDRAVFPRDKLCGDFINPINWPVLQELNVGPELLS